MTNIAFVVGNATYTSQNQLACCANDVEAVAELLESTGRYGAIHRLVDKDADVLKSELRGRLEGVEPGGEVFFFFSGHGYAFNGEFYYCARNFETGRPNQTGLPRSELLALFRDVSPRLVINVVDACHSGSPLIKNQGSLMPQEKGALNGLIQIASCHEAQTSLAGDLLSEFTHAFCSAALEKSEGPVYYTDIVSVLRDTYLQDSYRAPHFTLQTSARDTFVENASRLDAFKKEFRLRWSESDDLTEDDVEVELEEVSLLEQLQQAQHDMAAPSDVPAFVDMIFDSLTGRLRAGAYHDCFDVSVDEKADYDHGKSRSFMIRCLSGEKRQDNFVTASIRRELKKKHLFSGLTSAALLGLNWDDDVIEDWELKLNLPMKRAQWQIVLTPRFAALQRLTLTVCCAPSLKSCYIFEVGMRYPRTDWTSFDGEGHETVKKWYRLSWKKDAHWLVNDIATRFEAAVTEHIESVIGGSGSS